MSYDIAYTSCSINQVVGAAHWGKNNLICFASVNAVRIYDPTYGSGGKITCTLYAHLSHVNSVRWLTGKPHETELISASTDGRVIVWSKIESVFVPSVIAECNSNVIVADGCYKSSDTEHCIFIVSTSNNCIHIYERRHVKGKIIVLQNINLGKHIALTLKFSHLPMTDSMLFGLGTDTGNFLLYVENESGVFLKQTELNAHTDWVRGLDFMAIDSDLLLTTASQDTELKIWIIKPHEKVEPEINHTYEDMLKKSIRFTVNDMEFTVIMNMVLLGHDSWIYSVNFNKHLELISTSVDKTIIVWHKPGELDVWVEKHRFGEIGSSTMGYMGGMFGPNGDIFAHGFFGSFHLWKFSVETQEWTPAITVGGHAKEVVDLAWEPYGQFIYSVSHDQTTRIHAPWTVNGQHTTWHEIARPQIHGYEMTCLALLSRYKYAAGADEKVIRTFNAPRNFIDNFKRICKIPNEGEHELSEVDHTIPQGAALPSLGLSNKAIYDKKCNGHISLSSSYGQEPDTETNFTPSILNEPPTEEDLLQNTLWPETRKLYGHAYELFTMASTFDGALLASACKATSKEHACILLWDTSTWVQIDKLESHSLTVCQLAFSPDSKHLLSVSRDRHWTLFSKDTNSGKYNISATTSGRSGIHTRIIWCCAWLPDSLYFATGSRDGKVVVWKENPSSTEFADRYCSAGSFLNLKGESVTALAIAPSYIRNLVLFAVGLESGIIHLYLWSDKTEGKEWQLLFTINQADAHHKTVKRMAFRNKIGKAGCDNDSSDIFQLASCGSDNAVKVFDIKL